MSRVRLGLIGAGYWGQKLARNCAELGVLHSICDRDPKVLEWAREKYPQVTRHRDLRTLLASPVDGVIIAAPAELHAELALAAMDAGKHVFVEKPLALSLYDGRTVSERADLTQRMVFVGHLMLHHPAVQTMRAEVKAGRVGDVWHVRCRRLSLGRLRQQEDVLWSFAPHDISIAIAIMSSPPQAVSSSFSGFITPGVADRAYVSMSFSGGRTAHIEVSWFDPDKSSRIDVFGTAGVLTFDDVPGAASLRFTPAGVVPDQNGAPSPWSDDTIDIPIPPGEPLRLELQAFIESIQTGVRPITDAQQGVDVLRVLSMATGTGQRDHLTRKEALA